MIKLTDILKETIVKSPQEQMEDFINLEDKVRSSFISHKKIVAWHSRLKEKYPNLRIKFLRDGDVLRAEAEIDRSSIRENKTPLDSLKDELNTVATSWDKSGRKEVAKKILADIEGMADVADAVNYLRNLKYSAKEYAKALYVASLLKRYGQQQLAEAKQEEPTIGAFEEFADKRLGGAEKITDNAKEKGGPSMLTYHHFHVKLPYYKKAAEGKLDLEAAEKEYKELLNQLYKATKGGMNIEQIAFQKLVGKIEVLGELLIKHK